MAQTNVSPDRRSEHVALGGVLLQFLLAVGLYLLYLSDKSQAILAAAIFIDGAVLVWLVSWRLYVRIRLVHQEAVETAELKRAQEAGKSNPLFAVDDEGLLLEQSRLRWRVKWYLPVASILLALDLIFSYFTGFGWSVEHAFDAGVIQRSSHPMLSMWIVVGCSFITFMYAMYVAGLSRLREFRLLRAGAGFMAAASVVCLALALGLGAGSTMPWAEPLVAVLIRVAMVVVGIEIAFNQILEFYRPRSSQLISRPAFESRLLGLMSEPRGVAKSVAEAINYQFGFEVSSTWFYLFLQRWLLPLSVATAGVVILLSSVVIIEADERAVIETFGRINQTEQTVLSPGIHLKWPYPISIVNRAPASRVQEFVIGEVEGGKKDDHMGEAVIWTDQHESTPELMLLVATSPELVARGERGSDGGIKAGDVAGDSVAVSLMMVSMPIQYRVKNLHHYLYNYQKPQLVLEGIAYQYLSDYAAGIDMDDLMGPARESFNASLKEMIQRRADEIELGIEIVFVGLHSAHPPAQEKVAESYQSVMNAEITKTNQLNRALAEEQQILTQVAGSVERAKMLDEAILRYEQLASDSQVDKAEVAKAKADVEALLMGDKANNLQPASGEAAHRIADAQARASDMRRNAWGKTLGFASEVAGYLASPQLYMARKRLEIYKGTDTIRKIVLFTDPARVIVEYEAGTIAPLDRVLKDSLRQEQQNRVGG